MSNFLPLNSFTTSFDGDEVTFMLRPILLEDTLLFQNLVMSLDSKDVREAAMTTEEISEYVQSLSIEERMERIEKENRRTTEVTKIFQKILGKYIASSDLKDANGNPISTELLLSASYFKELVIKIGAELVSAGNVSNPSNAG